jgi:acyl-CoA reductase-like NAD-dependent aldehyde dehydrogenase
MKIYREEIFGPVLSVVRAPDCRAAVTMIDEHEFGNGVSIFTQNGNTARHFGNEIQVGMVGVNVAHSDPDGVPFPAGNHRSSAIIICTVRKACVSTRK